MSSSRVVLETKVFVFVVQDRDQDTISNMDGDQSRSLYGGRGS